MFRSLTHIGRLAHAAQVLARHRALIPPDARKSLPPGLDTVAGWVAGRDTDQKAGGLEAQGKRLAKGLEKLGPSYIKLGQLLATRPDLIGPSLARGLSTLHDRIPAFPQDAARAALEAELGAPTDHLFQEFGPPVAAASIAQVHKAFVTGENGPRAVAVKILRPGIERAFRKDLDSFFTAARFAERLKPSLKRLRPLDVVRTLDDSVAREMDLRIEAAAASEMAENTANDTDFRVPQVDWERTSRRILTTEWIDGVPLTRPDLLDAAKIDRTALGRAVLQTFLRHAMRDGLFHADMHPGNLFADEEGRLVAVDFGIMGRLDRSMRRFMAETLYGFVTRDYARVADVHFEAGFVPADQSHADFTLALRAVGEPIWGRPAAEMSIAKLLTQLFETTRRFGMPLQPSLIMLQKTMVAAEGVARDLDPGVSIWECGRPVLEDWLESEIGAEARLREAADTARAVGRLASRAPDLIDGLEAAAHLLQDLGQGQGLKLHPETLRALQREENRSPWPNRLFLGAFLLLAIAFIALLFTR